MAVELGKKISLGDSVKISNPSLVTASECSNCADKDLSLVTAVQINIDIT